MSFPQPSAGGAVAIAVAVLAGAVGQQITGMGFSLVAAPVLVLVLGATPGVRLNNAFSMVLSGVTLVLLRKHVRWPDALRLLVPAVAVTPAVAYVAHRLDGDVLLVIAGSVAVATAALLAWGRVWPALHGWVGLAGAGAVSATMNVMGGLSGPPVAMYGLNAGWPPDEFRATLQLYFFVLNVVANISLGLPRPSGALASVLLVAIAIGVVVGRRLASRVPAVGVRRLVLAIAAVGGVLAVARGLS